MMSEAPNSTEIASRRWNFEKMFEENMAHRNSALTSAEESDL